MPLSQRTTVISEENSGDVISSYREDKASETVSEFTRDCEFRQENRTLINR
jgi:hypothetical protein